MGARAAIPQERLRVSAAALIAAVMLAALVLYALLAGADFGGGVWDLLAFGPRAKGQRTLIEHALAPVWEANHVWLILIVVLLFTAFPAAFAALMTGLHTPLMLMLLGIVLRGSAFVFRQYGAGSERASLGWGRVFAVASTVTPVFLGVALGTMTQGAEWTSAFALCVGLFTLALFAMLAAVYLTLETDDAALQTDFRARALGAAIVCAALAFLTAWENPRRFALDVPLGASVVLGGALLATLWLRRFQLARGLAVALVALVIGGWAWSQYPVLWPPDITVQSAAAPPVTLHLLLGTLAAGAVVLFPSLYWLLRVFKSRRM
jgi:cytochrome bd ubiquinol oxidase subunit II